LGALLLNEKQKKIIDSAIKLFAAKGFSSTSIQEIVTESGISKGAFYLYFKSKDALLFSIFQYYFTEINKNISQFEHEDLMPREKFCKQLNSLIKSFSQHKEFIIMQIREEAIPLNSDVKDLFFRMHLNLQTFYKDHLLKIYGKEMEPYIWDMILILEGLLQSFLKILFIDPSTYQTHDLAQYTLKRMDSIVAGLVGEQVLVTEGKVQDLLHQSANLLSLKEKDIKELLAEMRQLLLDLEGKEDLEVSLDVLEAEIKKEKPRIPVIQGMLSNFTHVKALEPYRKKIASLFQLK
jgi:AcrR family transcriptional regulator